MKEITVNGFTQMFSIVSELYFITKNEDYATNDRQLKLHFLRIIQFLLSSFLAECNVLVQPLNATIKINERSEEASECMCSCEIFTILHKLIYENQENHNITSLAFLYTLKSAFNEMYNEEGVLFSPPSKK